MGILLDPSICLLADLSGIAVRSQRHDIATLVPHSLRKIPRLSDIGLNSFLTVHGYSAEGIDLEIMRADIEELVTVVPGYSIPESEMREWSGIERRLLAILRRPRWRLDEGLLEVYSSLLSEELHAMLVGRAMSPPRRHVVGFVTRGLHAFHPATSAFKRLGLQLTELSTLPMWLALKLKTYGRAKHEYIRNVLSSDQAIERWIVTAATFAILVAFQAPPLAAAISVGPQTLVAAINGGRLTRAALRKGVKRAE